MAVEIIAVGLLKTFLPAERLSLQTAAGKNVAQILAELGLQPDLVAMVLLNGRQVPKDSILRDGDIVKLVPLVGGG